MEPFRWQSQKERLAFSFARYPVLCPLPRYRVRHLNRRMLKRVSRHAQQRAGDFSVQRDFRRANQINHDARAVRRIRPGRLAALRTTGTALAVTGAMMMGAAVILAWPRADLLIAVGVTNCAILVVVAVVGRLPILHVAAVGCLALAALVGSGRDAEAAPG